MADDFRLIKERRFLGLTERRWIWLGRTAALALLAFACGFAMYLGADRLQNVASRAFGWAQLQIVGTRTTPAGTLRRMGFCYSGLRINCVVDGDTVWVAGEKIRLQSIDAPEIDGKCAYEKDLAQRAKHRLNEILSAEPFSVARSGKDRYGRTLAAIYNSSGEVRRHGP
jgi:endonuclease YncB( thermonuclease family)